MSDYDDETREALEYTYEKFIGIREGLGNDFTPENLIHLAYLVTKHEVIIEYVCLEPDVTGECRLLLDALLISIDKDLDESHKLFAFSHEMSHVFLGHLQEEGANLSTFQSNRNAYPARRRAGDDNTLENVTESLGTLIFMGFIDGSMLPPESARIIHGED